MFYGGLKPRGAAEWIFDPIKHVLRVFLNAFLNIPGKACVNRVHNNYAFVYGRRNGAKFKESKSLPTSTTNLQFNIFFLDQQ